MAKTSVLEREKRRKKLNYDFFKEREIIKNEIKDMKSLENFYISSEKLQKLPRNSAKNRIRNRCWKTGRPRGYFRFFGLCRNILREFAHECLLTGITKASW